MTVWSGSWRIATAARSTCGGRGSSWRRRRAAARPRSCAGPACPSPRCGAGRSGSCARAWPGLLRDKTRKPGLPPLPPALVDRVVALTLAEPPGETTHWTGRAMAAATGVSLRSVQRIWAAHGLEPHRVRSFKLSTDPAFAAKLRDVVGLYIDPPAHAVVLSVDEKSQIQALDRTQPGLPMKKGRAGTMTHDYIRNGTTTLFAALNVLDGTVIGQCMARHRHQELIRFLNRVEAAVPAGKLVHAILDNYAAHKHPKVRAWLSRHPRWTFHFTPTSCSWANAVETFFATLTRRRLRRGTFHSLVDLQAAINRYLERAQPDSPSPSSGPPTPTASSRRSIEGIKRWHQTTSWWVEGAGSCPGWFFLEAAALGDAEAPLGEAAGAAYLARGIASWRHAEISPDASRAGEVAGIDDAGPNSKQGLGEAGEPGFSPSLSATISRTFLMSRLGADDEAERLQHAPDLVLEVAAHPHQHGSASPNRRARRGSLRP